jgi:hypothetical protein
MPESRNCLLLDNGWLTDVSMEMRFHVNGINKSSYGYAQAANIFSMDTREQQTFPIITRELYIHV